MPGCTLLFTGNLGMRVQPMTQLEQFIEVYVQYLPFQPIGAALGRTLPGISTIAFVLY